MKVLNSVLFLSVACCACVARAEESTINLDAHGVTATTTTPKGRTIRITTSDIMNLPFDDYFHAALLALPEGGKEDPYFFLPPGREHYRLLAYLSTLFANSSILDIGTYTGTSALAFSYTKSNTIHSFDIKDFVELSHPGLKESLSNVAFHLNDDLWDEKVANKYTPLILSSPLLFVDINPHNGIMELDFYNFLKRIGYTGLVLWDDIRHFEGMRNFWDAVPTVEKYELGRYAHWAGTGLISFDKTIQIELGN